MTKAALMVSFVILVLLERAFGILWFSLLADDSGDLAGQSLLLDAPTVSYPNRNSLYRLLF